MFRDDYRNVYDRIVPEEALVEKTVQASRRRRPLRRTPGFRAAAVCAALLVCLTGGMTVLAATVPSVQNALYALSPTLAGLFVPVKRSCIDNGIKMEVESVYIHGRTAEILITLQDLTADRLDETTDLFDSYTIFRPHDTSASCQRLFYEEETKTAGFHVVITAKEGGELKGQVTFALRCFISGKQKHDHIPLDIDLSQGKENAETRPTYFSGFNGPREMLEWERTQGDMQFDVLFPDGEWPSPVDNVTVTGIGFVENRLHVQLRFRDRQISDDHGGLYLKDKEGARLEAMYSLDFSEDNEEGIHWDYTEFIFDLSPDEAAAYSLYGDFATSSRYVEGDWRVTFPLENSGQGA